MSDATDPIEPFEATKPNILEIRALLGDVASVGNKLDNSLRQHWVTSDDLTEETEPTVTKSISLMVDKLVELNQKIKGIE